MKNFEAIPTSAQSVKSVKSVISYSCHSSFHTFPLFLARSLISLMEDIGWSEGCAWGEWKTTDFTDLTDAEFGRGPISEVSEVSGPSGPWWVADGSRGTRSPVSRKVFDARIAPNPRIAETVFKHLRTPSDDTTYGYECRAPPD